MGVRNNNENAGSTMSFKRRYLLLADEISKEEWSVLGLEHQAVNEQHLLCSLELVTERVTSLLLIRLVGLACPSNTFPNLSTSTICKKLLKESVGADSFWPPKLTEDVVHQLRTFVRTMFYGYNNVPYHNFQHAFHVLLSSNHLLDMIIEGSKDSNSPASGLEDDSLMHMSLLFAAVIHDVEHQGVPNQQLVLESHPLAVQYNDQSVAEQRSLAIAFTELLKPKYDALRMVMFPTDADQDRYHIFRGIVTDLVLSTDIASRDRSELIKQKWKKSFERQQQKEKTQPTTTTTTTTTTTVSETSSVSAPPSPRDHPSPARSDEAETQSQQPIASKAPSRKVSLDSWIDLGQTPSTHFPRDTDSITLDSLELWWFTPAAPSEFEDTESTSSSSDDEFAYDDNEEEEEEEEGPPKDCFDIISPDSDTRRTLIDSLGNISSHQSATLQNEYGYPQLSEDDDDDDDEDSTATMEDDTGCAHLLSGTPVERSGIVRRTKNNTSKNREKEDSRYSQLNSTNHGKDSSMRGSKSKGLLDAFAVYNPKRKSKQTAAAGKVSSKDDLDKSKFSAMDRKSLSSSSVATAITTPDLSSSFRFNLEESQRTNALDDNPSDHSSKKFDNPEQEQEEQQQKQDAPPPNTEEPDAELCKLSLLEHILLVSDVAHTTQGWDLMIEFSHRLSQEIQCAIKGGRSGGNVDDPLADWYSNQSAFLHGYVLPLVQRLEATGYVPASSRDANVGLLSDLVNTNFQRWQEDGHDIVLAWKMEREASQANTNATATTAATTKKKKERSKTSSSASKSKREKDKKKKKSKNKKEQKEKDDEDNVVSKKNIRHSSKRRESKRSSRSSSSKLETVHEKSMSPKPSSTSRSKDRDHNRNRTSNCSQNAMQMLECFEISAFGRPSSSIEATDLFCVDS